MNPPTLMFFFLSKFNTLSHADAFQKNSCKGHDMKPGVFNVCSLDSFGRERNVKDQSKRYGLHELKCKENVCLSPVPEAQTRPGITLKELMLHCHTCY